LGEIHHSASIQSIIFAETVLFGFQFPSTLREPNVGSVALSQLHQVFELSSLADEEELSDGTIQPGLIELANRRA
jgi:hypothetical protein